MRTSFLLTTMVIVLSSIAILGVWVLLGVVRQLLTEVRQRPSAKVPPLHPND